jgi:hypothetical protein
MSYSSHIFADRIVNIVVTGPIVRLELGVIKTPAAEGQNPQLEVTQTVVMPLEGFMPSLGMMEEVVKKLMEAGVLKVNPPKDQIA